MNISMGRLRCASAAAQQWQCAAAVSAQPHELSWRQEPMKLRELEMRASVNVTVQSCAAQVGLYYQRWGGGAPARCALHAHITAECQLWLAGVSEHQTPARR